MGSAAKEIAGVAAEDTRRRDEGKDIAPADGCNTASTKPAELAYNWNFARNFPDVATDEVNRANVLETIADILTGETTVVFLEGDAGDGATTTLAQFCRLHPNSSFSLFIRPVSRFSYGLEYLRMALAEQLYWYANGTALAAQSLTAAEFEQIWWRAHAKHRGIPMYFIVDGVHQIPQEDQQSIAEIFKELLPIGVDNCRFIITGQQNSLERHVHGKLKSKPFQQLKLSIDESRGFLSSAKLDEDDVIRVHQMCRGIPGRLAVVKRLLQSGSSLSAILDADPSIYPEFVTLELAALNDMDVQARRVVSAVAFSKFPVCVADVAELLQIECEVVKRTVGTCQFLSLSGSSEEISFISVSHQKCAEKNLEEFRRDALSMQLEHLRRAPRSPLTLRFLPAYYETLNQQEAILELLSKEHYENLLSATHSFAALRARAELGARSALALKRTHEVFKFSVQRSIFVSAGSFEGSGAQIEALVAMGQPDTALALANSAAAKEDRLALLAAFARRVKERGNAVPQDLLGHIKNLIDEIAFGELGDDAVKIAANVMIFDPDLAIGIIESAVKGASEGVRDSALAELSLNASMSKLKYRTQFEDKASPKISDAALQLVTNSFAALAAGLEVGRITSVLTQMPVSHRMYFLRSFVKVRKDDASILDLVEYGLDTMVREAAYTPRLSDLAELAAPLTAAQVDESRVRQLVARFDSQMGLAAKNAQSKALVGLQMRLAAAELHFDPQRGRDRIEQAIYEVLEVRAPEVQLECYGLLLSALGRLEKDGALEQSQGFRALVKADLSQLLQGVLKNTAEQLLAVAPMLNVLAADDADAAMTVAASLNTESRRNKAFAQIARVIATQQYSPQHHTRLTACLAKISDSVLRAEATLSILGPMFANSTKAEWLESLGQLRGNLVGPEELGVWDIWIFKSLEQSSKASAIAPLLIHVEQACEAVQSSIERANLYFRTAEALADCDAKLAGKYYELGASAKTRTAFNTDALCKLLELCLSLIARSFAALAKYEALDDDKLRRFGFLATALPSALAKARAYADLAERLWCVKRTDLANDVAKDHLHPVFIEVNALDLATREQVAVVAFPALSVWHLATALRTLDGSNTEARDVAIYEACMLRLRKLPCATAEDAGKPDSSRVEPHEVGDVIALLEQVTADAMLFTIMNSLFPILRDKRNRTRFTLQQKADWATRCRLIVARKLPDPQNIKHIGFKIVCTALTYSIEDTTFKAWEELAEDAKSIENVADRSYVFMQLASCLPTKYEAQRNEYLKRARQLIDQIPSPLDRLSHLQDYAEVAHANNSKLAAMQTIRDAMQVSLDIANDARAARHRRALIDLADRIDSKLADELIELIDDDPARALLKADAKRAGTVAKARRDLADAKQQKDAATCRLEVLPQAAWKSLAALESGRLDPKPIELMTEYVSRAGSGTLHDAFPVLSWHIANLERKCKTRSDVDKYVAPVCESLLLSTEIAHSIVSQEAMRSRVAPAFGAGAVFVGRNDKDAATEFIANWLCGHSVEYIKYCDMYFSSKDVALLRLFATNAPNCSIRVIASKKHLVSLNELSDAPFRDAWAAESDESPPETQVIAIGQAPTDANVVHDRWLVTNGGGLRFGSSFGGLGAGKASEVSELGGPSLVDIENLLDQYIGGARVVAGAKMQYFNFTVD